MRRRPVQYLVASVLFAPVLLPALPAAAVRPAAVRDFVTGVWRVERRCITGCSLSQAVTITVASLGHGAYSGTGSAPLVLYPISSTQVIVHSKRASSLLTVKTPGRSMTGAGVGTKGETFDSTWQCVSAHCGS